MVWRPEEFLIKTEFIWTFQPGFDVRQIRHWMNFMLSAATFTGFGGGIAAQGSLFSPKDSTGRMLWAVDAEDSPNQRKVFSYDKLATFIYGAEIVEAFRPPQTPPPPLLPSGFRPISRNATI